ncbi:arginine--tRNA ligase [Mycoplasmopsis caviae]|uniref:arginine--tRNA ligase n=1 Tax=Mycoplasmopsis caviae TaxID=55603 RepID=A0A3P8KM35_9BACT|nr:arginine--tRNA ligase [Mycoplasmopsis caviae]UUD35374.1 arginine--tRNA ligase [Mycoplasmopsis caviae]VDR41848.1 Arginyl-tRNA synthetase [Mycoplasmopsis caviae]
MLIVHKLNKLIKNIISELKTENKVFSSFEFANGEHKFSLMVSRKEKLENSNVINHIESDIVFKLKKFSPLPYVQLAEEIKAKLIKSSMVKDVLLGRYGLINIILNEKEFVSVVNEIIKSGAKYGWVKNNGLKINIEYASALPLNSLTVHNLRNALVGECLAKVCEFLGYQVTREYLVYEGYKKINEISKIVHEKYLNLFNDKTQQDKVCESDEFLEAAKWIKSQNDNFFINLDENEKLNKFNSSIVEYFVIQARNQLNNFGILFDIVSDFKNILVRKKVEHTLEILSPLIYDNDSNLFLNTNEEDSKDRILVHKSGRNSYLLLDIIYHLEKLKRADKIIDILDSDHIQYSNALLSVLRFLNVSEDRVDLAFCEKIQLKENQCLKSISKFNQNNIFIDELVKNISIDELKFFFLEKRAEQQISIDKINLENNKLCHSFNFISKTYNKVCKLLDGSKNNKCYSNKMSLNSNLSHLILRLDYFPYVLRKVISKVNPFYLTKYLKDLCILVNKNFKDKVKRNYKNFYPILESIKNVFDNGFKLLDINSDKIKQG